MILPSRAIRAALVAVTAAVILGIAPSCALLAPRPATLYSDVPEMAVYAELFNAAQSRYRMVVVWRGDLETALGQRGVSPDLVVGAFLKSQGLRDRFQALDYLFGELTVNQAAFYPSLLAQGESGGRQILLPVSFDLPAIVYSQGGAANVKKSFLLGLDDLAPEAKAWNRGSGGGSSAFTKMGFSPRWDPEFLVMATRALGAAYREARPLTWNGAALDGAVNRLRAWTVSANTSPTLEDDFQFKYLYTPAYKYLAEGRALFGYLRASDYFLVPEEKRSGLDFRWYAEGGKVPVLEGAVYAGIPRAAREKGAAEAFLKWFYREDNQRRMLENARLTRSLETSFGIAGGLSAVRTVTERAFPGYYRGLVGHLPPSDGLLAAPTLPATWRDLDARVLAPWLLETTAKAPNLGPKPGDELSQRLAAWYKDNRRQ